MATLLSITNRVLSRLREDTVAAVTDTAYASLVAEFVADIAQEVNEAAVWSALNHDVTVSVIAGTTAYTLSGVTQKSLLLVDQSDCPLSWMFADSSGNVGYQMNMISDNERLISYNANRGITQDYPLDFSLTTTSAATGLQLTLNPAPASNRYIRMRFNTPEAVLTPSTDGSVTIKVPEQVVYLGALFLAQNERGEEIGEPGNIAQTRYITTLADAKENEIRNQERAGVYDWYRA